MPMVPTPRIRWSTKQLDHPHSMPVLEQAWSDGAVEEWRSVGPVAPPMTEADIPGVADLDARYVQQAGDTMSGGLSFGATVASGPTNTTRHVALWHNGSTQGFGFSVTGGTLNYVADQEASYHKFYTGSTVNLTIGNGAITASVPVVLAADPTAALEAATKQYVDGKAYTPPTPITINGGQADAKTSFRISTSLAFNTSIAMPSGGVVLGSMTATCPGLLAGDAVLWNPSAMPPSVRITSVYVTGNDTLEAHYVAIGTAAIEIGSIDGTLVVFR